MVESRKRMAPALSTSCSDVCCDVGNRDVAVVECGGAAGLILLVNSSMSFLGRLLSHLLFSIRIRETRCPGPDQRCKGQND